MLSLQRQRQSGGVAILLLWRKGWELEKQYYIFNLVSLSSFVRNKCSDEVSNDVVVAACITSDRDRKMWLPAAHDGDSNQGNNKDHSGCS